MKTADQAALGEGSGARVCLQPDAFKIGHAVMFPGEGHRSEGKPGEAVFCTGFRLPWQNFQFVHYAA